MIDLARVVATHPEANAVDLVLLATGQQLAGVQVLSGSAGAAHGFHDLPRPAEQVASPGDAYSAVQSVGDDRATLAAVAFYRGMPVVIGFLFPQVAQCLFAERDRMVYRHASDLYFTVDGAANAELSHPAGVHLRIGETPAHEDLTGQDFDGVWKIERNTGRQPHVMLKTPTAEVHIDPAGNVRVAHQGNLTVETGGDAVITVAGSAAVDVGGTTDVTSGGAVTVDAPTVTIDSPSTTCTGALLVQGPLTFQAGMAGSGGSGGATAVLSGSLQVAGGDVTADGIGLKTHRHSGVQTGGGTTGASVA